MSEEIDFIDLMSLKKIQPDTVVEKFGSLINSSFFDASNVLGTLKIKDLVDFTNVILGQNSITVTDVGKKLIEDADNKALEPIDQLDHALLVQLSSGKRSLIDISGALNIRPKDLAMHLYKLDSQEYITSNFRNGNLDLLLTEKGFTQSKIEPPTHTEQPQQVEQPLMQEPIVQPLQESEEGKEEVQQTEDSVINTQDQQSESTQLNSTIPLQPITQTQQSTMNESAAQTQQNMADMERELLGTKQKRNIIQYIFGVIIVILMILIVLAYFRVI